MGDRGMSKIVKILSVVVISVGIAFTLDYFHTPRISEAKKEQIVQESSMIDLVGQNPNIVYGLVFDMVNHPSEYQNRMIRMDVLINRFEGSQGQIDLYALIPDATKCCAQGLKIDSYTGSFAHKESYRIVATLVYDAMHNRLSLQDAKAEAS